MVICMYGPFAVARYANSVTRAATESRCGETRTNGESLRDIVALQELLSTSLAVRSACGAVIM